MKKQITKILLIVILFLGSSQVVHAESYQRWIYWINTPNHQVTSEEMAEIVSMLYEGKILPDKVFKLSTGVSLRIPQPGLYFRYIKNAVKAARPSADTKEKILNAISRSEKMRWGNDVAVLVKNYWVSNKQKTVVQTNDYSGEGRDTDFLFIDGIPFIKCDCGNPLEPMSAYRVKKEEKSGDQNPTEPPLSTNQNNNNNYGLNQTTTKGREKPINLEQAVLGMETKSKTLKLPEEETKNGLKTWHKAAIASAAATAAYLGGRYAWYHWIKVPKPVPATIWMDPPLDQVVKSFPGQIQPKKSFTFTLSL